MSNKVHIDDALAKLEAGKFSFQMVDAIKDHISRMESELQTVRALHAEAVQDLQHHQYAVWRLESEVQKLNGKIHGLIRANALVEKADRAAAVAFAKIAEYAELSKNYAIETGRSVANDLRNGDLPAPLVDAKAKAQALQARLFDEKTVAEIEPYIRKAMEGVEAARKHAHLMVERAAAYLSTLHKTAA